MEGEIQPNRMKKPKGRKSKSDVFVANLSRDDWELVLFYEARADVLEAAEGGSVSEAAARVQELLKALRDAKARGVPGCDESGVAWGERSE
jgi:hypothetical protein